MHEKNVFLKINLGIIIPVYKIIAPNFIVRFDTNILDIIIKTVIIMKKLQLKQLICHSHSRITVIISPIARFISSIWFYGFL